MVEYDSSERGVRVGDGDHSRGLTFHCGGCQHYVMKEWAEIKALGVIGLHVRDLARRLRCVECGSRKGGVMIWAEQRI